MLVGYSDTPSVVSDEVLAADYAAETLKQAAFPEQALSRAVSMQVCISGAHAQSGSLSVSITGVPTPFVMKVMASTSVASMVATLLDDPNPAIRAALAAGPDKLYLLMGSVYRVSPGSLFEGNAIMSGSKLECKMGGSNPIAIGLKTLGGIRLIDICADRYSTVREVQQLIRDKKSIPPDQQRLIFEGKQMEEGATLIYYNITMNAVLYLILMLRGD